MTACTAAVQLIGAIINVYFLKLGNKAEAAIVLHPSASLTSSDVVHVLLTVRSSIHSQYLMRAVQQRHGG